jgi:hypothetical protein
MIPEERRLYHERFVDPAYETRNMSLAEVTSIADEARGTQWRDLSVCEHDMLSELLYFWTLSIVRYSRN